MKRSIRFRQEKDALGNVDVPEEAYYGAQTQRAVENFPISGLRMPKRFIDAVVIIKRYAALVNKKLSRIEPKIADAVAQAAQEILDGAMEDQFVVDVFQTGSGTSTNMNVNEVIASRANEILTGKKGGKSPVHPNDHVNSGQSSNDVIPTALHISVFTAVDDTLIPSLKALNRALAAKSEDFKRIRKIGRTHLQDAVPMTLGQEFSGYARQIHLCTQHLESAASRLRELALGGTAVGTGINTHPEFAARVIKGICEHTGLHFQEAENHFAAQAAQDASLAVSGALKTLAAALVKISNDIRWLASGPRCGIGEIRIPSLQPGSSIMPGKINPVIPESVIQASYQVMGNDTTIALSCQSGVFELNVTLPVIIYNLLQSVELLGAATKTFTEKCIAGITANSDVCEGYVEKSLALATALVPQIGYDKGAEIAQQAHESGKTIREVVREQDIIPEDELDRLLSE